MATATASPSSSEPGDHPGRSAASAPPVESGEEGRAARPEESLAIRLAGVHKRFRKYTVRGGYTTVKSSLVNRIFRRRLAPDNYIDVLKGIDLEVPAGTTLGIMGANGSGKSTLLKVMAGIIRADAGEVEVRGRISPLIELGAGFHPEFSGRENVYLNALVVGMTKAETEERYDSIVEFAGLADFIDDPVRTYSSGMYMRLAFSVAIHADPDVLLIDEILAVGDESFTAKCHERIAAAQAAGKTIVLVSHSLDSIERWCHEAIWINQGHIAARGSPASVTRRYHASAEPPRASTGEDEAAPALRDSLSPGRLQAGIRIVDPFVTRVEGRRLVARGLLEIQNLGDTLWRSLPPTRRGMVTVGGRLHSGERYLAELAHALIPRDLHPTETAIVEFKFPLPEAGDYRVVVDLVDEEICWFAERGSEPLVIEVSA
jgi:ABC-type polysaccharide/polyol phosphate transport system ATPase subunit